MRYAPFALAVVAAALIVFAFACPCQEVGETAAPDSRIIPEPEAESVWDWRIQWRRGRRFMFRDDRWHVWGLESRWVPMPIGWDLPPESAEPEGVPQGR